MTARRRNLALGAAALVVVAVIVAVAVSTGGSGSKGSSSASPTTSSKEHSRSSDTGSTASSDPAPTTVTTGGSASNPTTPTTQALPLQVRATSTTGMHDGQTVTVTVTADPGSDFYDMDARLCAGTPAITNFYDFTPDPAGNCILHPLSPDSDNYVDAPVGPPYRTGTLTFRVGVGTARFTTENLQNVAITCGPGHPCQLVVRLQYPKAFGFRSFPVTYAG
jgi:hypothetical protein